MMGLNGTLGMIVAIFLIIGGIMALFIPFWIFRIRNEAIDANRRLAALVELSKQNSAK